MAVQDCVGVCRAMYGYVGHFKAMCRYEGVCRAV